jgi:hypothetical protein
MPPPATMEVVVVVVVVVVLIYVQGVLVKLVTRDLPKGIGTCEARGLYIKG